MTTGSLRTMACIAAAWLGTGAHCPPHRVGGEPCSTLARTFFGKPSKQRIDEFTRWGLDRQFTTYICAVQYMHPPMLEFVEALASQGQPAADYLREKLTRRLDDDTTRDVVHVFEFMSILRTYDVAGDAPLMRLLEDRVKGMGRAANRARAQEMLDRVREP